VDERGPIDHLDLSVSHVDRSTPLYDCLLTSLGFVRDDSAPSDRARWNVGGAVGWDVSIEIRPSIRSGSYARGAAGLEHVAFRARSVEDVDRVFDALRRAGFDVREPPRQYGGAEYPDGYYALGLEDPDGIHLEVVHQPAHDT
jgi:glyoxylase I family protein